MSLEGSGITTIRTPHYSSETIPIPISGPSYRSRIGQRCPIGCDISTGYTVKTLPFLQILLYLTPFDQNVAAYNELTVIANKNVIKDLFIVY